MEHGLHVEVTDATPGRTIPVAELVVGQSVWQRVVFDAAMREGFDRVARDRAPVHDDERFARAAGLDRPILQGLAVATRFSRLIGMYLPGERAILEAIEFKFRKPVHADTTLVYRATIERVLKPMRVVTLALSVSVDGAEHVSGRAQALVG